MAAEGVFGQKIQYDAHYNWGVNIKVCFEDNFNMMAKEIYANTY